MSFGRNKSCVTLNSNQNTTNWAINSTAPPIGITTSIFPPLILYTDWDMTEDNSTITYYQFCGPLIVLLREFGKYINTETIILSLYKDLVTTGLKGLEVLTSDDEMPSLMIFPVFPLYIMNGLTDELMLTRFIGGMDADVIMSKTRMIERSLFSFLNCWDHSIYLAVFLSILTISLTIGLIEKSFNAVFEAFWDYSSVFLSESHGLKPRTIKTRLLAIIWLLVNTILLSIYSGELYEIVIKGQLIDKIEVKEDLVTKNNWKNSKVIVCEVTAIDYILSGTDLNDPVAMNLAERNINQDPLELYFKNTVQKEIMSEVLNNNEVILANKLIVYYLVRRAQNNWPQLMDDYIEGIDFYISKSERSAGCYYLVIDEDRVDLASFNLIITRLQESGIYEYEVLKAVTPSGFGPAIDQDNSDRVILKPIQIRDAKGIFFLSLMGFCIATIVLVIEIKFYTRISHISAWLTFN